MEMDSSRWAKKFDTVAHIYDRENGHGVLCKKWSHCLGNNYATKEMETCIDCLDVQEEIAVGKMQDEADSRIYGDPNYEARLVKHESGEELMD
jgi:hypothetical protein